MRMITRIDKSLNGFTDAPAYWIESGNPAGLLPAMLVLFCSILASACESTPENRNVFFVDRSVVFPDGEPVEGQMLVVGINKDRMLSLNKFEIGRITEASLLAEKLNAVFDDRRRAGVNEREVIVEMNGAVGSQDLKKLVEMLESIEAGPIRIVRHDQR